MKKVTVLLWFVIIYFNSFGFITGDSIKLADPTIFYHQGTYYLYGTGGKDGFLVYTSPDMQSWAGPAGVSNGYALIKGQSYGTKGFWAPQVIFYNHKFYMAYTADEHIAIAESGSPLGPFTQKNLIPLPGENKQIDPYIFIDDDGKKYLYHVRLGNGNRIFTAELKDDFSGIVEASLKECIAAEQPWENTDSAKWPVAEGPAVIKHEGLYYLIYSANDFRNINYAVGYAVSKSVYGPWEKYSGNPFISRNMINANGPGHGDFIKDTDGNLNYVFHVHASANEVSPRKTVLIKMLFEKSRKGGPDKIIADAKSFHYLMVR